MKLEDISGRPSYFLANFLGSITSSSVGYSHSTCEMTISQIQVIEIILAILSMLVGRCLTVISQKFIDPIIGWASARFPINMDISFAHGSAPLIKSCEKSDLNVLIAVMLM